MEDEPKYLDMEITDKELKIIYDALCSYEDDILDGPGTDEFKQSVIATREIIESRLSYEEGN